MLLIMPQSATLPAMGIFGAIAGGSLGFMVGGPVGAILGSVFGSRLGEAAAPALVKKLHDQQAELQAVFAVALTSLAAKVAKADGRVTHDEIAAFDRFLKESMGMTVAERETAAQVFNLARDNDTPASEYAKQLGRLLRLQPDRLRDIVTILFVVAFADGKLHPAEEQLIESIARDMGLSPQDVRSCKANYSANSGEPLTSPYEILGLEENATDAEVRSAHRRIVREYHPDVLQSKGMPDEFMAFAKQKLIAGNDAWARIKAQRGL